MSTTTANMNNATTPNQPIGYINDRLSEATTNTPFRSAQLVGYVVKPNTQGERGAHPEYLGPWLRKADAIGCNIGEVVCYERTVNGYDTMAAMQSGDTAWISEESASTVYMKLVAFADRTAWLHIPNHKVEEAGGDPYKVEFGYDGKHGLYFPC